MKAPKEKLKKGVSPELLHKCVGTDLEKHRLAPRDVSSSVEKVVYETSGKSMEAEEWLKLNKKNLNA